MKQKFVLSKNSLNTFLGLTDDHMRELKGGLAVGPGDGPYYPTGGGGGGGGGDPWLPVEDKPMELEPNRCEEGYVWDNVLNRCVRAYSTRR